MQYTTHYDSPLGGILLAADEDAALEAIAAGDSVRLVGFGSFVAKERKVRTGHDPTTGEPVFKTGKQLKDAVNTT